MSRAVYAIGDIHGQLEMLEAALKRIEKDGGTDARIIFLGDYVDRGTSSPQVLDLLIEGKAKGKDWHFLLGNHDQMFSMFMEDYPRQDSRLLVGYTWQTPRVGGLSTMQCYGVTADEGARVFEVHAAMKNAVPGEHIAFLRGLKRYHQEDGLLFVHAGIKPGIKLEDQDPGDLIWIRDEFLNDTRDHGVLVVHGHSNIESPTHYRNRVNLDSGAAYGRSLTAAVFDAGECYVLTDDGRMPLRPTI